MVEMEADLSRNSAEEPVWYKKWFSQCRLLLWKNWRIMVRNRRATITQLCAPALFVVTLFFMQIAIETNPFFGDLFKSVHHQSVDSINDVPLCVKGPHIDHCWTFLYSPNDSSIADELMNLIRTQNDPEIPENSIRAFATPDDVDQFLYDNRNTSQAAILWNITSDGTNTSISYVIQLNQTSQYSHGIEIKIGPNILTPIQYAIDKAIFQFISQNQSVPIDYDATIVQYAHPQILTVDIIGGQGPTWFFAAIMFNFVVTIGAIVQEKEQKLRAVMQIMGLYDSAYWFTWLITSVAWSTMTIFILIITGCIFQFNFFLKNAFGLYFFLMELFALAMVPVSFLISAFVKKASNSTSVGFLVFILGFFVQLAAGVIYSDLTDDWLRNLFSLFPPSTFTVGLYYLGDATEKDTDGGVRWSAVEDVYSGGVISFGDMYRWLVLDFFLYLLLALYFDNITPNAYGVSKPLWYPFMPSYWLGSSKPVKAKSSEEARFLDGMDEDVKHEAESVLSDNLPANTAVIVRNLSKVYEPNNGCCGKNTAYKAVDDLCLSIQEDTLLCLLGPNGAGKTTTIHMLVGFHSATGGDAMVYGHSITQNLPQVQQLIGLCPQFDILWNELTGEEHLYLFAGLRNIPKEKIAHETDRLLKEVELQDAAQVRSSMYSGGMRRRLSVAISLIGNPKIVFLDEPTTGMDPVSRRKVWNCIERAKKNKVIVLTTHSMEEADILGDKIAIMAGGHLQCVGSSLRLKQRFGAGYRVTVGTQESKTQEVIRFFESKIKGVQVQGKPIGGYINLTIPRQSNHQLVPFFENLEKIKKDLGIHDLQLSLTTLEEVFLNVAESAELKRIAARMIEDDQGSTSPEPNHKKYTSWEDQEDSNSNTINSAYKDVERGTVKPERNRVRRRDQFKALLIKTAILQKREISINICQVLTPIFLIAMLFLLNLLINSLADSDPIEKVLHPDITSPFHLLNKFDSDDDGFDNFRDSVLQNGASILYSYENPDYLGNYSTGSGFLGMLWPSAGTDFDFKFQEFDTAPPNLNSTFGEDTYNTTLNYFYYATKDDIDNYIYNAFDDGYPDVTGGYVFNDNFDPSTWTFSYSVMYNYSLAYAVDIPVFMNRISNAVGRLLPEPVDIVLQGFKPFPTHKESGGDSLDLITLAGSFFYVLILHQLFPVFLSNIVYEKESKIKDMTDMMGLKSEIYWIVTYLFDYLLYMVVVAFLVIAGVIFQFRVFTINTFASYFILFILWGHVLIAQSFLMSTLFSSRKVSLIIGYFYILGIGLICAVLVDDWVSNVGEVSSATLWGISVVPPFAMYRGLVYLASEVSWGGPGYSMSNLDDPLVNMAAVYGFLIVEWFVMMALWMYLQQVVPSGWGVKKHPLFFLGFGKSHVQDIDEYQIDPLRKDVVEEREKALNSQDPTGVTVLDLRKVYPAMDGNAPKVAVKGVSFGIEQNSCLGVLGHNGAGKTTTINMLIGLIEPTSGNALIRGKSLTEELSSIYSFIGVCPQHDILWDKLTGKEHLEFYGRIKNLKGKALDEQVSKLLKQVNLYESRNKQSCKYSGGMKRRLSVAIALIGHPKVVYLDEPSTGLDPKSRQDLWAVINEAKSTASVILTTHSMEEADAICDRLMIMAEGEIECIGVSADLKRRFGDGYKLAVQVARGKSDEPADKFIRELIPQCALINELAGTRNYEVPKGHVTLEKVFRAMEENKERLNITDWAITNTTLEEVFLKISMNE